MERSVILLVTYVMKFVYKCIIIWIVTDLCSFVAIFAFILSIDYRQYWHTFYSILKFFIWASFLKIIFFIFYAFVVYEPVEGNFIFLACREHKTRKKIFFKLVAFRLHLTVSLSQRQVFSSMLNFAWGFFYQWNRRRAILPQTQICKFGRTKFHTHTVLSRDEVLISLIILLQVLLSSWRSARKVQLSFLHDLAFHLRVAKNFLNNFFMTWAQKEFASVVVFNRK